MNVLEKILGDEYSCKYEFGRNQNVLMQRHTWLQAGACCNGFYLPVCLPARAFVFFYLSFSKKWQEMWTLLALLQAASLLNFLIS